MKRVLFSILVFCIAVGVIYSQSQVEHTGLSAMDAAVKGLASELNKKITEEKAGAIALGEFSYEGSIPPFGQYWANQLIEELINQKGSFSVLSGGASGAGWQITGEIVGLTDTIRVYTRLVRSSDRNVRAAFHSDFERDEYISQMLPSGDGRRRSAVVPMDAWEPDSWDNPVPYEIGSDDNSTFMQRTIHNDSDEDFFLLLPEKSGRLVMETSGSVDTYMELYNAESREMLDEDDDGGSGYNARIRYDVITGRRYIVKVRGYGGDDTGPYGFRAYYQGE